MQNNNIFFSKKIYYIIFKYIFKKNIFYNSLLYINIILDLNFFFILYSNIFIQYIKWRFKFKWFILKLEIICKIFLNSLIWFHKKDIKITDMISYNKLALVLEKNSGLLSKASANMHPVAHISISVP